MLCPENEDGSLGEGRCGVMQMNEQWPAHIPPHWMPYFAVENSEVAVQAVEQNGGKVVVPSFPTPFGTITVVSDPTNAIFSIVQLPA